MAIRHDILHRDGAKKVYESPAIAGQYLYFTNRGDDILNGIVGKGNHFFIENPNALPEASVKAQFTEDIQLKDAYIFWEGAVWGDSLTFEVELPANTLFLSATDQGNVNIVDGLPVAITTSITPDATWTGTHLFFPIDIILIRFVNEFGLNGTNSVGTILESTGVALINKELKIKMSLKSDTNNPNIKISVMAEVYRETTI